LITKGTFERAWANQIEIQNHQGRGVERWQWLFYWEFSQRRD
jgi:hypothetical protein